MEKNVEDTILMEVQATLPYPIEEVFALTVDLEKAPRWHNIFSNVQQLSTNPIGRGTRWQISYKVGRFELEITDYQPPHRVTFQGSRVMGGTIPNFSIVLYEASEGTEIRYIIHPDIPSYLRSIMGVVAPPYGRRDLDRYFRELEAMLAAQQSVKA